MITDALLDALLAEDAPLGDLTTMVLGIGGRPGRIRFAARAPMVLCCVEDAERMLIRLGARTRRWRASGEAVDAGEVFLEAEGCAAVLHLAWKTGQNLMEHASGIATSARRIVEAGRAVAPHIAVACTRKSFPGTRAIAAKAVVAGGAQLHRAGLSETLLVFPEHYAFLGGIGGLLPILPDLKRRAPEKKLVVETGSVEDAVALARHGAEVIQLERLSPDQSRQVVERTRDLRPPPLIAAAGGVNEQNAGLYADAGCAILVTSAPYFARPADVGVTIESLEAGAAPMEI